MRAHRCETTPCYRSWSGPLRRRAKRQRQGRCRRGEGPHRGGSARRCRARSGGEGSSLGSAVGAADVALRQPPAGPPPSSPGAAAVAGTAVVHGGSWRRASMGCGAPQSGGAALSSGRCGWRMASLHAPPTRLTVHPFATRAESLRTTATPTGRDALIAVRRLVEAVEPAAKTPVRRPSVGGGWSRRAPMRRYGSSTSFRPCGGGSLECLVAEDSVSPRRSRRGSALRVKGGRRCRWRSHPAGRMRASSYAGKADLASSEHKRGGGSQQWWGWVGARTPKRGEVTEE